MSKSKIIGPTKTPLYFEAEWVDIEETCAPYSELKSFGGWDKQTNSISPMQYTKAMEVADEYLVQWALESVVLAFENGLLNDKESFVKCFESPEDIAEFCGAVRNYNFWVNERIFWCFNKMLGIDEEGLLSFAEFADVLEFEMGLFEQ